MISNHKIQTALDEIKEISKIDLALYSEKGKQVAATFEPEGDMEEAIEDDAYVPEVREVRVQKYKKQPVRQPVSQLKLRRIRFIDDNRSHVIDAGENSKIIFEIMNEDRKPVYNVVPVVETVGKVKHIGISPSVMVEEILPGEGIRYTASIHAGNRLKDGEVTFRVAVADENGVICDSQEFTLPTQR